MARDRPRSVALYSRISTREGLQETRNQVLQLRQYCDKQGWQVVAEYRDQKPGNSHDRPQFRRLFQDARQRKFDLVFFWSLDRFSREGTLETLKHLEKLNSYGVDWKSYTEEYLDSCGVFREAIIGVIAAIAKQERVRRSERAKAAVDRLRKTGKTDHLGRPKKVVDRRAVWRQRKKGASIAELIKEFKVSRATLYRILKEQPATSK